MDKSDKKFHGGSFNLADRLKSVRYAVRGIIVLFKHEHNARIHLFILLVVITAGLLLRIQGSNWLAILFVTGLVFVSECFNTALEYLADQITEEENENIRRAKDVAAAGVLISAAISVVTGIIIFLPEIFRLIRK
jgi:diacylglycerol kinase (ATP)